MLWREYGPLTFVVSRLGESRKVENRTSLAEVVETAKRRTACAKSTPGTVAPFPAVATDEDLSDAG